MVENESIIEEPYKIAETFNNFFISAVSNLNIPRYVDSSITFDHVDDEILRVVEKYNNHPSAVAIKNKNVNSQFSFRPITKSEIYKEILNLDISKASQDSDIATKIVKANADIFTEILFTEFERSLEIDDFPTSMKLANVTPVHKKGSQSEKGNYRPVSILPNLSKVFERCIYKQIYEYFENILSKYQCGFRKCHSAQHFLIALLEKWRESIDRGSEFGILLTDLSKAFDCLPHDLFVAKLSAYGFDNKALCFTYDYLKNRKQRTKISGIYSCWQKILYGVPQGSILGPLLFNIDLCDMFFILDEYDIANYANDSTSYVSDRNTEEVIASLEEVSKCIFQWFRDREFQGNASKCHVLLSTNKKVHINIGTAQIENSQFEKLLGVTLDSRLTFEKHIQQICGKASSKLKALARITPLMDIEKRKILMNAFFNAQFSYCPLTWMFHSRNLNNKINKLHERCLRIVYKNNTSSYEDLLEIDNSVSIHTRNLQSLATELHKIVNGFSPDIMKDVFPFNTNASYNIRNRRTFRSRPVRTVNFGSETLSYLAPKIWELIPENFKTLESVASFKTAIKKWKPDNCLCRLCREYIYQVGFV